MEITNLYHNFKLMANEYLRVCRKQDAFNIFLVFTRNLYVDTSYKLFVDILG